MCSSDLFPSHDMAGGKIHELVDGILRRRGLYVERSYSEGEEYLIYENMEREEWIRKRVL